MISKVTAVSYLHCGVIDSAVHVTAESSTSQEIDFVIADFCHSSVNDSAITKSIFSALTRVSGA
jgi:hypothetical protein